MGEIGDLFELFGALGHIVRTSLTPKHKRKPNDTVRVIDHVIGLLIVCGLVGGAILYVWSGQE